MEDLKKIYIFITFFPTFLIILIIFLVILVIDSSGGDSSIMAVQGEFSVPFPDGVEYIITSEFGDRISPTTNEKVFHNGIDVSAPVNTDIVSSASGMVVKTGFNDKNLGNYVYIEHNVNGEIYYTAYEHMADNSIVVGEGELVEAKQKIGVIGSTGDSTGIHLHFVLMSPKLKYDKENSKDPKYIFEKNLQ